VEVVILSETKVCSICNDEKELNEYYSQKQKRANGIEVINYHPYCKECAKVKARKRHHENKEDANKKSREWYWSHREEVLNYMPNYLKQPKYKQKQKEWRQDNPNRVKEYGEKYKDKQFKLPTKQWKSCKEYFSNCCAYCGISELEAKNIQGKNLNKEHAFNLGSNDLSNCVPSCTSCNSSKHMDDYIEWYIESNPVYNMERLNKIEKWLNEDHKKYL
jgi:hypothetical protein